MGVDYTFIVQQDLTGFIIEFAYQASLSEMGLG